MASISGIQGIASYQDGFSSQRANGPRSVQASTRNTGLDTLELSADALTLPGGDTPSAKTGVGTAQQDAGASASSPSGGKEYSALSKVDFFKMLMESLFLAELNEARQNSEIPSSASGTPEGVTPEKTSPKAAFKGQLEDGDTTAAIKKVLSEIASGRAEPGDIAKTMAVGTGKVNGASSVTARQNGGDANVSTPSRSEV